MNKIEYIDSAKAVELAAKYGTPLYVYREDILQQRCREIRGFLEHPRFIVNYSAKANSNLRLLEIVRDEGLQVDAMSPGEIFVELKAGFKPEQILFVSNNVSADEFQFAVDSGVKVSVDSLSQLELYGQVNSGGEVFVRFNPGIGAGHHKKVITGGSDTKFGVDQVFIDDVKTIAAKYNLKVIGINQHIGSYFNDGSLYLAGVKALLNIAKQFNGLKYIDFGGGFGIPSDSLNSYNIKDIGGEVDLLINAASSDLDSDVSFMVEPGRYIVSECGTLLGTVNSVKTNYNKKYIGTDLGFNIFMRTMLYDAQHTIDVFNNTKDEEKVTVVGNICESGDIMANDRILPVVKESDIIGIRNAGAYGYSMSSNYNNRLRPAEVLLTKNGDDILIRRRDKLDDLMRNFI